MFGWQEKRLKQKCVQLEDRVENLTERVISLTDEKDVLEDSVAELNLENNQLTQKRQMEDEMIAHKLKMREESVKLDADKRISEAERKAAKEKDDGVAKVKDKYRDKLENQLEKRGDEMKEMYSEILTRLPDVNMAMKHKS